MSEPDMSWRRQEPHALARFVQTDLPGQLRLPGYINRRDLLRAEGPRGLVEQLYKVLISQGINDDPTPFDPGAAGGQPIRTPQAILDDRRATSLDLTLLLAGMCLANDLLPVIVVVDQHAFLGVSLTHTRQDADQAGGAAGFVNGMLEDLSTLQAWAKDDEQFLFVECTGAAQRPANLSATWPEGQGRDRRGLMSFTRACEAGTDQLLQHTLPKNSPAQANQRAFQYALHVYDLQAQNSLTPRAPQVSAPQRTHTQTIQDQAQVGVAIAGDAHGPISHTTQSGGVNFGSGNQIGTIGDIVAGDKVAGDKVAGDKINAQRSQGFINKPTGPVTQHFGEERHINTGGGDYAEGNIDKRKGIFGGNFTGPAFGNVEGGTIAFGGQPAAGPPPTALEQAINEIQQASQRAHQRGDDDLAEDLQEVANKLDGALKAERTGNPARRAAKLTQARTALQQLALANPQLGRLAALLQQVQ